MGFFSKLLNVALFVAKIDALRLMQYNVEWLFIDYYKSADCPGNGCTWHNESVAYDHLYQIGTIIDDVNPDIINFCEVEGINELNILQESLKYSDDYTSYLLKGTDTSTGQNVGLITKIDPVEDLYRTEERSYYPISNSKCGYTGNAGTVGVSKHLITKFIIQEISIYLVGVHFLSNPTDPESCAKREAQAQVIQNKIQELINNKNEVILIGDLNDYDGIYKDINNNEPTSSVLNMLKGNDGNFTNYTLYTISSKILQDGRYTEWYDMNEDCIVNKSEYSMIDHILVTEKLFNSIEYVEFYKYKEGCKTFNSDHFPIVIRFGF